MTLFSSYTDIKNVETKIYSYINTTTSHFTCITSVYTFYTEIEKLQSGGQIEF